MEFKKKLVACSWKIPLFNCWYKYYYVNFTFQIDVEIYLFRKIAQLTMKINTLNFSRFIMWFIVLNRIWIFPQNNYINLNMCISRIEHWTNLNMKANIDGEDFNTW